ncbi:MAG: hypothetical protein ACRD4C_14260 [Candidatus Acidiferrales bacterium]
MRLSALALALSAISIVFPVASRAQAVRVNYAELDGHFIGETTADFLRIEPDAQQEVDVCRQRPARRTCDRLIAAIDRGQRAEVSNSASVNFVVDGGRLVKLTMLVDGDFDDVAADLTKKFGARSSEINLPSQNEMGAKWQNHLVVWDTPNVYVTLYKDNNPSLQDQRAVLIAESQAEHLAEDVQPAKPIDTTGVVAKQ